MKRIIVFETSVRLGANVFKYVGPFNSTDEAEAWYEDALKTWKIEPPYIVVADIFDPMED